MTKNNYTSALFLCLLLLMTATATAQEACYDKLQKTYTLHADGSQEYRCNTELTLFTHTAMNSTFGESFITYNPEFQELKIHSSYTRQKDGSIVKTPDNAFVEVLPRAAADAPAWNHLKEMVVVHTGLELGATIYLDYSILTRPGYLTELDIYENLQQPVPVKECTVTLNLPEGKPSHYALKGAATQPKVTTVDGMKQICWRLRNLTALPREYQAKSTQLLTATTYASPAASLKTLLAQFTPAGDAQLLTIAESLTEGKTTEMEKVEVIHNYVQNQFGKCALNLQGSYYRLRPANDVINSAYATEAEKANLISGLLIAAGIQAEVVASYNTQLPAEALGLSAIDELFVLAKADGNTCTLTTRNAKSADAVWTGNQGHQLSLTRAGEVVTLPTHHTNIHSQAVITLTTEKAVAKITATIGKELVPYYGDNAATLTGAGKEATMVRKGNDVIYTYTTEEALKETAGYVLVSLPDLPLCLTHSPFVASNSSRQTSLRLPYLATEQMEYSIQLPEGMKLATPVGTRKIDNATGNLTITIGQTSNTVTVSRQIVLKEQTITPALFPAFRTLINHWTDVNGTQLLIHSK
ncbi:MAG: DUF3857 domain-containing protein [Tannerellaceae bacterium]